MANQLSETARTILQLIAEGYTIQQLATEYTPEQIQDAAREALELESASGGSPVISNPRIKTSLRTYEVWTEKEDSSLMDMVQNDISMAEISEYLQRHPMTIRRRMVKLGLA